MRALLVIALASAVLLPTGVEAQPRLMLGGGISSPNGDFSASAEAGYHLQVGLQVGIPTLPVGFRADGGIHRMGQGNAALVRTQILVGSLSGVLTLPGIGLSPYLLAGVGSYQTEAGLIGASEKMTETGYHGGFGVNIGAGGLGAFAEIRFVQIKSDTQTTRFIPMTFGIRL
ncbi:MAG: outer membrane beta-barrel protein [Gemmatimonadetes bacterium]|nr:outer membrane beta-barrel protein [Gemmatimonadota bacterium]MDA1102999.1 outer membrane beta-barrel protein [Gemmatimonadota bacterium]